jgi:CRISPR-associated protein Csm1
MENIREHLYLAALLHDIGKFYQRADKKLLENENELSPYSKNLANDICPVNEKGRFGYQHVIWTNEFLGNMEKTFNKVLRKQNLYEDENTLSNLACNHHSPKTELQALISLADWWSAGIDRHIPTDENDGKLDKIKWGNEKYKKIPLFSIFNTINNENYQSGFPLTALDIKESCFPKNITTDLDGISQEQYKIHWNKFVEEFDNLPTDSFNGFVESLLYLLKKYTWCIPSNTMDMANVSLFEHLKTTAAFADCLYLFKEENPKYFTYNNITNKLQLNDEVYPVLLLGGDLSGIQKFIYNIASRKAALSLKGRSFYLQLLIYSVIQRIVSHSEINVNIGNVVYSSGGKFYML